MDLPRVLVAAPTSKEKKYCFLDWLENAMQLNYPNYNIRLFDNSRDNGVFCLWMNKKFWNLYGRNNSKFLAIYVPTMSSSVIERLADCSNEMRAYAIQKNYPYLLSLESDVFCPQNTIEELMCHEKKVIGALYDRDEGKSRKLTIQKIIKEAPFSMKSMNFTPGQEIGFVDGTVKEVSSVGLGCVLVDVNKVLKRFAFRFVKGDNSAPDRWFSEDCFRNKIPIYAHAGITCSHENNSQYWFDVSVKERNKIRKPAK